MPSNAVQVVTATATQAEAHAIGRALVERRLAACVQVVGPVTSTYWWRGQIEVSEEWLCVAKTRATLYAAVERAISDLHSYEVPEILAFTIDSANPDYLRWLHREVPGPLRAATA